MLPLNEQEVKPYFYEKEDEMKDEMLWFSDDKEKYLWIELREESDSSRVNASEGGSLLRSEEFGTLDSSLLSLKMAFKMNFLKGSGTGLVPITLIIWKMEVGLLVNFLKTGSSMYE